MGTLLIDEQGRCGKAGGRAGDFQVGPIQNDQW